MTYPFADLLVVQSKALLPWARRMMRGTRRVALAVNPVRSMPGVGCSDASRRDTTIVGVGRFVHAKGFDLLLRAFGTLAAEFPAWRVILLGDGEERARLETLVCELGISKRVAMPGWHPEPADILKNAGMFVLPSRYEGFPNALLEAMACGAPSIATRCCGAIDAISDEFDGLLVREESSEDLAAAMRRLMTDRALRDLLGRNAVAVTDRYDLRIIIETWNRLIASPCTALPALRSSS